MLYWLFLSAHSIPSASNRHNEIKAHSPLSDVAAYHILLLLVCRMSPQVAPTRVQHAVIVIIVLSAAMSAALWLPNVEFIFGASAALCAQNVKCVSIA